MVNKTDIENKKRRFQRASSHFSRKIDRERENLNEQREEQEKIEKELAEITKQLAQVKIALEQSLSMGNIAQYKEFLEWLGIYQEKIQGSEQAIKKIEKVMSEINERIMLLDKKRERSSEQAKHSHQKLDHLRDENEADWFTVARNNRKEDGNQ